MNVFCTTIHSIDEMILFGQAEVWSVNFGIVPVHQILK